MLASIVCPQVGVLPYCSSRKGEIDKSRHCAVLTAGGGPFSIMRNWPAAFGLLAIAMMANTPALAQQKPNVVFILADNVGCGDLGAYGGGELRGAADATNRPSARAKDCGSLRSW